MKISISIKLVFIFLFSISVAAQNSAPKLPTRAECEACANKKAKSLLEKYGSAEMFVKCLMAGGTSAQMVQVDNLLKAANAKKEKFALKSSSPTVRFLYLREIKSYVNLVDYSAEFAMKFPFKDEYTKNVMKKHFDSQKTKAQELRDWTNRMQATLDKDHPDIKKQMDDAIMNVKMECYKTWGSIRLGKTKPETLFLDAAKSDQYIVGCAEVEKNIYDFLESPSPKNYASSKPKKLPYCSGKNTVGDWSIYWTNDRYTLKPKLHDIKKGLSTTSLMIQYSDVNRKYMLTFNFDAGNYNEHHIQQIYVDGAKIHQGQWTIERYPQGHLKSSVPPSIEAKIIYAMESGSEAEIRVMRNNDLVASARFSLKGFRQAMIVARAGKTTKYIELQQGKCKKRKAWFY